MTTKQEIINKLPSYERNSVLLNEISGSVAKKIDDISSKVDRQENELFIDSASTALALHERDLGIVNNPLMSNSLRRSLIQGKYKATLQPVTEQSFKNVAASFSTAEVTVKDTDTVGVYEIEFLGREGLPNDTDSLLNTLDDFIPAHLDYQIQMIMLMASEETRYITNASTGEVVTVYPYSPTEINVSSYSAMKTSIVDGEEITVYPI
ncbi:hypothetical protein JOD29_000827 [Lysinibacillus composti]|uniref:DUF2313 domain-containing protein n=1 Tax=Lysinibacillus composti TaxID=720633 RepID=A0A3N9UTU9_9BACI|nr:putative phage tail protein [Lysinibacillus composti]MBM7607583.1 hypothetical protein [Lysinibacillus composti]RQW75912.1 DUF2313 domain-containing protein [Lysinibacillus composti]